MLLGVLVQKSSSYYEIRFLTWKIYVFPSRLPGLFDVNRVKHEFNSDLSGYLNWSMSSFVIYLGISKLVYCHQCIACCMLKLATLPFSQHFSQQPEGVNKLAPLCRYLLVHS